MPERKPRLLFLAWTFPPSELIGAVRAWNMALQLSNLGWAVTVMTPDPEILGWKSRQLPPAAASLDLRYTGHDLRWLMPGGPAATNPLVRIARGVARRAVAFSGLEHGVGWNRHALERGRDFRPGEFDVVLATGRPFASFAAARRLARRLGCPYVVDYRDSWTSNPRERLTAFGLARLRERRLLRDAAAVLAVSPSLAASLDQRLTAGKLHVVTNGFDPDELANVIPHDFGHFAFVYAGTFYPPNVVIAPVVRALAIVEREDPRGDWRFHYYGANVAHVSREFADAGLQHRLVAHGPVSRQEALSAVAGAGMPIVITSVVDPAPRGEKAIVTGKLFEFVGLRKPALLVAPPGSDAEEIANVAGLIGRFSGREPERMAAFMRDAMSGRSLLAKTPEAFAWPAIAPALDAILRRVASSRAAGPAR